MPGNSYGLVEQTTVICHCHDCVGFVKAFGGSGEKLLANSETQLVQFYKSDVTVTQGSEPIGTIRLSPKTAAIRLYCRRRGTPLGTQAVNPVPIVLLNSQLLSGDDLPVFLLSLVLNLDSALPGTRHYGGCTVVRRGVLAPWFLVRVISRMLLGLTFGKAGQGLMPPDQDENVIAVGIESIEVAKTKDQ
jgi:hypothetical protein